MAESASISPQYDFTYSDSISERLRVSINNFEIANAEQRSMIFPTIRNDCALLQHEIGLLQARINAPSANDDVQCFANQIAAAHGFDTLDVMINYSASTELRHSNIIRLSLNDTRECTWELMWFKSVVSNGVTRYELRLRAAEQDIFVFSIRNITVH
ncbi:hypothetical protein BKA67DRAFT_534682 [Truncatella angustata]|uniref:Uncharacterized protein n=1 Tax=Truncatella angustata TaxID=152316 RepID=A0A9P8UPJ8_9PEZI|nr:uncharacterized protein BKA67DRAFT_534682 [Truncatella angustata]KAH6655766.1 hypothetical protein BKA67DRAFT_534682 [Truncatella angustata]